MKIKKIITLLFSFFLSATVSYCSQGGQPKSPLFFEVVTMYLENSPDELEDNSRNVDLFLKNEDEGLVLCLHDDCQHSYLPLLLPAALKLCMAIEKNQLSTVPKEFMEFDVNTKDKSRPILCDINLNENKKISSAFLEWVRPLSANIHISDSVTRSNSINTGPEPERTCIDFNPHTDLTQLLFPKSLEGMPAEDIMNIAKIQFREEISQLRENNKCLSEECLKKLQRRRNENIFMLLLFFAAFGFAWYTTP